MSKNCLLNGYLNEEVYMEQPEGFVNQKYPNRVCKLKRSIYGLKQASRQWNKHFNDEIKKFGFSQNADEPCVYLKASGSNVVNCVKLAAYILGNQDLPEEIRSRRLIGLCQSAYIEKILKRYHMENSKRGSIPMQEKLRLSKSQGASTLIQVDLRWTMVSCYTDAGYLMDADDLKSQTGYVFVLNRRKLFWVRNGIIKKRRKNKAKATKPDSGMEKQRKRQSYSPSKGNRRQPK
ncbi:retrotransposon protein, putative, ty1-copia subclass [Tanacetum coccineum]